VDLSKIDVFVAPRPKRWMIRATTVINRVAMLHGVSGLRDIWPFSLVPGIRGISNVRIVDLPDADFERLKATCGAGKATFIVPNHPEFFTDWMIDKELLWRTAPMAASWATHTVVNGPGGLMQKFWLANNLIAQIPGNSDGSRRYSVEWAAKGNGVLLHPEGSVGWHNDWIAPLLPGAVEMAADALALGRGTMPDFRTFVVPVGWKFVFLDDAEPGLRKEAAYVRRRLGLPPARRAVSSAQQVFDIYDALTRRDFERYGLTASGSSPLRQRHAALLDLLGGMLTEAIGFDKTNASREELLRAARRWLRENRSVEKRRREEVRELLDDLARVARLGAFAFEAEDITQEQVAEHLKRLRNDYCKGTLRDSINRFVPQPVAPRKAIIRVPEPIEILDTKPDVEKILAELRHRLQAALDQINAELRGQGAFRVEKNPFRQD
jgi:hypothetical protein